MRQPAQPSNRLSQSSVFVAGAAARAAAGVLAGWLAALLTSWLACLLLVVYIIDLFDISDALLQVILLVCDKILRKEFLRTETKTTICRASHIVIERGRINAVLLVCEIVSASLAHFAITATPS